MCMVADFPLSECLLSLLTKGQHSLYAACGRLEDAGSILLHLLGLPLCCSPVAVMAIRDGHNIP